MNKINAQIVADSRNENGDRITTFLLTYPRIIHAEILTHRSFSRNAASSRAIPFKRMLESIQKEPFIPIAWQKDHSGMQGTEYIVDPKLMIEGWLLARDHSIEIAFHMNKYGLTKQLCNRLLEPFQYYTSLVTATEFENYFSLRCPQYSMKEFLTNCNYQYVLNCTDEFYRSRKDFTEAVGQSGFPYNLPKTDIEWLQINKGAAEIHLMDLAEKMWDAFNESKPNELKEGEWHIPFEEKIDVNKLTLLWDLEIANNQNNNATFGDFLNTGVKIKVSTGMSARTSYTVVGDEKEVKYETLIGIHDRIIVAKPIHASPLEHCARAMNKTEYHLDKQGFTLGKGNEGRSRNFKGFIQYREIVENGDRI